MKNLQENSKLKYFVLSDVHNNYNYMLTALTEKGFDSNNKNHKIILVGDAFDKGPNPVDVYFEVILNGHDATKNGNNAPTIPNCTTTSSK